MNIRSLLVDVSKTTWQCSSCGALYVENEIGELEFFQVASEQTSKNVLVSKGDE